MCQKIAIFYLIGAKLGLLPVDPLVSVCGVERRAEFSALGSLAAVSWPWVPAWGSLEPSRRGGENAQKTGKNGEEMGEIRSKKCERGKDRRDHLAGLSNILLTKEEVKRLFSHRRPRRQIGGG